MLLFSVGTRRMSMFWKTIIALFWGYVVCRQDPLDGLFKWNIK